MRKIFMLVAACLLIAAAPRHIQTADYWAGYAGTKDVPPDITAKWLTWAETDTAGARRLDPYGVKTILYTNPYRIIPGEPMYSADESTFAHDCSGNRITTIEGRANQYLMNPESKKMIDLWRNYVKEHLQEVHFDAVFTDDAAGDAYVSALPCNYSVQSWLDAMIAAQKSVGAPVIYNALEDYRGHGVSKEIALNATAFGGMLEECYAQLRPDTRATGWRWYVAEQTELQMAQDGKHFFCYGRDLTPADQAIDSRVYTYASFLLTYDPNTSVLWEYYQTPSRGHVMPESQLVALAPVRQINNVRELRGTGGVYMREYKACYIDARPVGACVAAVNPDDQSRPLFLKGYARTLALRGSGVFDGGTVSANGPPPPQELGPRSAVIAFRK